MQRWITENKPEPYLPKRVSLANVEWHLRALIEAAGNSQIKKDYLLGRISLNQYLEAEKKIYPVLQSPVADVE